jgi:hypothetical protein
MRLVFGGIVAGFSGLTENYSRIFSTGRTTAHQMLKGSPSLAREYLNGL